MTLSDWIFLRHESQAIAVSPLRADGIRLRDDAGEWTGVIVTAFRLGEFWCNGWDVDTFLAGIAALDAKGARLICNYDADDNNVGIGRFNAFAVPDFGRKMRDLAIHAATKHGLILQFTAFADQQRPVFAGVNRQAFFGQLCAELDGVPSIVDWGNERPKNGMTANEDRVYARFDGVLLSRGSNLGDQLPPLPVLPDAVSMGHYNRDDFVRRIGKTTLDWRGGDTNEGLSVAGVIAWDEGIGLGEADEPGRTCSDPWKMYQATAWAVMCGAGYNNAHLRTSINDLFLPGPNAADCVRAMAQACREIPTTYAEGELVRGNSPWQDQAAELPFLHYDSETITNNGVEYPGNRTIGAKRSYCLWMGNDGLFIVIEPMYAWNPDDMLKPGFSIVESWGYGLYIDTVYRVRRG